MTTYRPTQARRKKIAAILAENNYISVEELSQTLDVSIVTIRRDLIALAEQGTFKRTHGGIIGRKDGELTGKHDVQPGGSVLADRADVLIVTVIDPVTDRPLLEQFIRRGKPVIAESLPAPMDTPVVSIDNAQASYEIGQWAAHYALQSFSGQAHLLDLGYHLANTQTRSQCFLNGLRSILPGANVVLSANAQSNATIAYQLTRDALQVHPHINLIFAINDTSAYGAVKACEELNIDPEDMLVIPFGLEGDTVRSLLLQNRYIKAGIAMFPEAAALICLQAAIDACAGEPLPAQIGTPYAILCAGDLTAYYHPETGKVNWEALQKRFSLPNPLLIPEKLRYGPPLHIGFTMRYRAHEWYRTMRSVMVEAAEKSGVILEIIDIAQTLKDELAHRRVEIAHQAARRVRSDSVIFLDSGPFSLLFAQALAARTDLTGVRVVTNASDTLGTLQDTPNLTVVCTGGILRRAKAAMVGPAAELSLASVRADQAYLMVSGVTTGFGLSHIDIAEASIKQAMIRAARDVILLADYTCFGQESFYHFAPLSDVDRLITDDTLPASLRLELAKSGISVLLADDE